MILETRLRGEYHYAETWPQMVALIDEVMTNLGVEDPTSPWVDPGENAWFMFVEARRTDPHGPPWPDNYLVVGVNSRTGYGGLTWFFTEGSTVVADQHRQSRMGH